MNSIEHKNHILSFEKYCQLNEIKNLLINKYNQLKYENNDIFNFKENQNQMIIVQIKEILKRIKKKLSHFKKGNMNKTISSKNNTLKIKVHNYFKYNKYKLSSPDYKKKR